MSNTKRAKPAPAKSAPATAPVVEGVTLPNGDIRLLLEAASALASQDLPFDAAMRAYEAVDVLAPIANRAEKERQKLIAKHAGEGGEIKPGTAAWEGFARDYQKLMETEQTVRGLPSFTREELAGTTAKGHHLGALRRAGMLTVEEAVPPEGA